MNDEELIQENLLYISNRKEWTESILRTRSDKEYSGRSSKIISRMIHEDLLERFMDPGSFITSNPQYIRISHLGLTILESSGGYIEWHKKKLIDEEKTKRKAELELSKLEKEVILTKWQYIFFWIGSGIAVILFIKEVWSFFN